MSQYFSYQSLAVLKHSFHSKAKNNIRISSLKNLETFAGEHNTNRLTTRKQYEKELLATFRIPWHCAPLTTHGYFISSHIIRQLLGGNLTAFRRYHKYICIDMTQIYFDTIYIPGRERPEYSSAE